MERAPHVHKKAFLARFNSRAKRVAVDTRYEINGQKCDLVIIYSDGREEIFKGLRAA